MRYWDASALVALCVEQEPSRNLHSLLRRDNLVATWWGTVLECQTAFARMRREGAWTTDQEDEARRVLDLLAGSWTEVEPGDQLRYIAGRLLLNHPLRAADACQLAAALIWADRAPKGQPFVCLDRQLGRAARNEGFEILPKESA
jgi:uncharacterized protein